MRSFAVLFLATLAAVSLHAQAGCPGNARAIPFHNVNQHQMLVGVSINHSGPYDFLLDTGTQMTVLDRSLAADLHVNATGPANVAGMSVQGDASYAQLDRIEVGDHGSANLNVLVYDMKNLQAAGFAIRGLLGDDFLSQYNVLIDNAHNVLCLNDTGAMQNGMKQGS